MSHEGIRPISINGQGDTCCLIVTDGYAQITMIDHLLGRVSVLPLRREKGREKERKKEINRKIGVNKKRSEVE